MSMKFVFSVLCAGILTAMPAQAKSYKKDIKQAEKLGQALYDQDIAAWVASDRLYADRDGGADIDVTQIKGWLSYEDGPHYRTIFISNDAENPAVLYEAISKEREVIAGSAPESARGLNDKEMGLWKAREFALTQEFERCEKFPDINTSVIKRDKDEGYIVYLMASSRNPNEVVLGKHHKLAINTEANEVISAETSTNSCFALRANGNGDGTPAALMASHLKTPYPQEYHVFVNLSWELDLFVSTKDGQLWKVKDGDIKKMKD